MQLLRSKHSVYYWFTSSDEDIAEAASTLLVSGNVPYLKVNWIRCDIPDLHAFLHASGRTPFQSHHATGQTWSRFPTLISFCCYIPGATHMSAVEQGTAVHPPYFGWLTKISTAQNLEYDGSWTLPKMKWARKSVRLRTPQTTDRHQFRNACRARETENAELALECVWLSPWTSFLEKDGFRNKANVPEMYVLLTLESLQKFTVGI